MSVSCPKERLDGHALSVQYPLAVERRAGERQIRTFGLGHLNLKYA